MQIGCIVWKSFSISFALTQSRCELWSVLFDAITISIQISLIIGFLNFDKHHGQFTFAIAHCACTPSKYACPFDLWPENSMHKDSHRFLVIEKEKKTKKEMKKTITYTQGHNKFSQFDLRNLVSKWTQFLKFMHHSMLFMSINSFITR